MHVHPGGTRSFGVLTKACLLLKVNVGADGTHVPAFGETLRFGSLTVCKLGLRCRIGLIDPHLTAPACPMRLASVSSNASKFY